ncbi:family 78 glycoside hydrolase catalytic domain [Bacteroides sp. GD17]|jgi:alpha-L-rhamnosidase|uniref:alpha-L-rhamnosidase n=1 Tax=Bacteroides sp. GD17 TaxID=3139826 RepID=UPI0025CD775C|nr:alpha-L-rhamnosidase [uncultured Bacteroides sp.]
MKIYKLLILFFTVCMTCQARLQSGNVSFSVRRLQTEYAVTPLGIDTELPRFSWQMEAPYFERGQWQAAYQITVSDEEGKLVWNSEKTKGGNSLNIEYAGIPLQPSTRYWWTVNVWNQKGEQASESSWFETGLMSRDHAYQGWDGAKWIGGGDKDMTLYSHYLPVFRLDFSLRLDKVSNSTRASFIYGANDTRLMDRNKNLYHLENKKNESYIKVELDIAPLASDKEAILNIYRVGYHPDDKSDTPYVSFPIPQNLIDKDNKYACHVVKLSSELGFTKFYIDNSKKEVGSVNLNPLGQGGDFIAFPVVGDIGFFVPAKQGAFFSKVNIVNYRTPSNVVSTVKDGEYRVVSGTNDFWEIFTPKGNSSPMLRTVFASPDMEIAKARLYVTARGIYEIYLNGRRVGNDYFNPGVTQYNKTHLYQTFDVTDYIHSGQNAIGAFLAEGWWSGGATFTGDNWNFFGDRQSLLAKLVITYKNGQEKVIVTDPSTWQYFSNGPILYGSFFQGEVYDALKDAEIEGWSTASYTATNWKPATEVVLEGNVSTAGNPNMPWVNDYSDYKLMGQFGQTVQAVNELTALSVEEVRPGVYVYDMGQNMVGVPKVKLSGIKPGTRIYLRFAEVKYPDLPEYAANVGMIMLENIRAAMAQDIYIARGGEEIIFPRFTYHGYRFIEITGIDTPIPIEAVKGVVLSSIHKLASHYETSNAMVNKLWENITWSSFGNFLSIPTDCPQRNERLGWAGDISVFSRTATYLADVPQFLRRYLQAMRDVQRNDGCFPDIAPLGGGFGGLLWGSAGITVPWECYQQYGDKVLLNEHYDAMKQYISHILDKMIDQETGLLVQNRAWGDLGDWLGLEDEKNDRSLLWEAYFIYDLELMHKMAVALGKGSDAEWFRKLHDERKAFFNKIYIRPSDSKTVFSSFIPDKQGTLIDIQTSYVLPLVFDIINNEQKSKVIKNLIETVTRKNTTDRGKLCPTYSLMTGFIGTAWISKALSDNGYSDIAYHLLQQTSYPSWLYSVDQGATTIWERLNSYTHVDGFGGNNRMNSFNHYSFGAVGSWMYNYSLGIQRDEASPGFKHFILKPEIDLTGKMKYAKGYYDSMYGRIGSGWKVENEIAYYTFNIPGNTSALVCLPASSVKDIKESGKDIHKKHEGIKFISEDNGTVTFELLSGNYFFEVKR